MFALKRYAALAAFLFCAPVIAQPDPPTDLRAIVGVCVPDSLGNIDTRHCDGDDGALKPSIPVLGPMVVYPTQLDVTLLNGSTGGTAPYTQDLWCGPGGGTLVQVATGDLFATVSYHSWTGRTASTLYDCQIRAVGADGRKSNFSAIVSATTLAAGGSLPGVPGAQSCDSLSTTTITCSWSAASGTVTGYNMTLGQCPGGVPNSATGATWTISPTTSYTYIGLTPGTQYYTRESANTAAGAGNANAPVCTTTDSGSAPAGNIISRDTFESYTLGTASQASMANRYNKGFITHANGSNVTIANSDPVFPGAGKYLRPFAIKLDDQIYRTELWYVGTPYRNPRVYYQDLGGGDGVGLVYWYGYVFCLDQYTGTTPKVHFNQWHTDIDYGNPADLDINPAISLFGDASTLQVYIEHNEDGPETSPVLYTDHLGNCIDVIWQFRADTRLAAAGSTGILRLYLNEHGVSNSTPKFEWVNKRVSHPTSEAPLNTYAMYFNFGGYLSGWRWWGTNGQTYEARYDNLTIMDSTGSYAAMLAALAAAN